MSSADNYDWLRLADEESIVWSGRPRRVSVVKTAIVVAIAVAAVGLYRHALLAIAVPVGIVLVGWTYLRIVRTHYVLTDAGVYRRTGVLGETVERASVAKIQNVDLSKGVLGTQFGFGSVEVSTAGGRDVVIGNVVQPDELKERVDEFAKRSEGVGIDAGAAGTGGAPPGGAAAGVEPGELERLHEEARALREVAESLEDTFTGGDA